MRSGQETTNPNIRSIQAGDEKEPILGPVSASPAGSAINRLLRREGQGEVGSKVIDEKID